MITVKYFFLVFLSSQAIITSMNPVDQIAYKFAQASAFCIITFITTFIFWFINLLDILKNEFEQSHNKIIWVLVVILLGPLGALLYFFMGRFEKKTIEVIPRRRHYE
jgi:hypothetical protein